MIKINRKNIMDIKSLSDNLQFGKKSGPNQAANYGVGVIAGAALGATAAMLMQNPKNREKVGEVINKISDHANKYADKLMDKKDSKVSDIKEIKEEFII